MKATVPAPAAALLDFIAKYESNGNYLAYYGHADSLKALPATLDAVIAFQHSLVANGAKSSALGRYEFMPKTLQSLMSEYKIPGTEAFTTDLQDELAFYLLRNRGYDKWIAGNLTDDAFADNISMEWASMPYHTGNSYYGGDGLNKALVSRSTFMAAIGAAKNAPAGATQKETSMSTATPAAAAAPKVDFVQGLINTAETFISGITSSISVAVSPNNAVTVEPASGSILSGMFSSVTNAQLAVSQLGQVIADAKAGKWSNEPEDVIALLQTLFGILSKFGINIPVVSQVVAMLPTLPPVQPAAGSAAPVA